MARQRTAEENRRLLKESLENIEVSIAAYKSGKFAAYRSVSTELHILLCNAGKGKSFIGEVIVNPTLHPIKVQFPGFRIPPTSAMPQADKIVMRLPHQTHLSKETVSITELFDESLPSIELAWWLDQKIAILPTHNEVIIRQLLSEVRNQQTGHIDQEVRDTVDGALAVNLGARLYLEKIIIALGEYVVHRVRAISQPS